MSHDHCPTSSYNLYGLRHPECTYNCIYVSFVETIVVIGHIKSIVETIKSVAETCFMDIQEYSLGNVISYFPFELQLSWEAEGAGLGRSGHGARLPPHLTLSRLVIRYGTVR